MDANVGVARKLSMEPNIKGARGFIDIQCDNKEKLNDVNIFTAAEMLTPMSASHDDAIRTAISELSRIYIEICIGNPSNCWELPCGQSAAKSERKGSTTNLYTQVSGNGGHRKDEDIVSSI